MSISKHQRTQHNRLSMKSKTGSTNLEKLGVARFDFMDPYHFALTLTWPEFFAVMVVAYVVINVVFAMFFLAVPGSIVNLPAGAPVDAFFFSVETLATVGYGVMSPATLYGHVVATIEIFIGMLFTATMTGVVFVRFSKPKAKIIFPENIVVAQHHGRRMLMIRIGNGRLNALYDAVARISALIVEIGPDGRQFRRAIDLKLTRNDFPFFPLTWTVMHELDDSSPLRDLTDASAPLLGLRLMLSITARDPALGAQVYAAQSYRDADIAFGMRYADAVSWDGGDNSVADMRKISELEPESSPPHKGEPELQ